MRRIVRNAAPVGQVILVACACIPGMPCPAKGVMLHASFWVYRTNSVSYKLLFLQKIQGATGSHEKKKRQLSCENPVDVKIGWRRAGDSNPRFPCGEYSLSRRAPSASRSALR